ncbi:GNAT family N-acetyltransferase [Arthrobacter mobilis]|uniref:N-acetyltransferase n=1 Tax=Arthrobacter mobilis TaxID=2724944 RepID=A0A7X6HCP5_9MICC|nr:N-acetyltransferase [Arthrobacter mobilis]NKX53237.1 N-acetyltransferase [Arthrobacter mobilis]
MELRSEQPADRPAILRLARSAFGTDDGAEPPEPGLLAALFACEEYIPELSVVAMDGGEVAGHCITTRAWIGSEPALGLGPLAVLPERQRRGIGAALLAETRRRALLLGERVIVLLGHTSYYPRFGYRPAAALGILAPDPRWGDHFMALPLAGPVPSGPFRYAAPFAGL